MSYIHPRDLDENQPMIQDLSLSRKFKSYIGIKNAKTKLLRYLTDIKFVDIATAAKMVEWNKVPVICLD